MHASLAELLENLKPGLLWVARDGVVRYANAEGTARTGLATGRKLYAYVKGEPPRTVGSPWTHGATLSDRYEDRSVR